MQEQARNATQVLARGVPGINNQTLQSFTRFSQAANASVDDARMFNRQLSRVFTTLRAAGTEGLTEEVQRDLRRLESRFRGTTQRLNNLSNTLTDVQQRNVERLRAQAAQISRFFNQFGGRNFARIAQQSQDFSRANAQNIREVNRFVDRANARLAAFANTRQFEGLTANARAQ